MSSPEVNLKVVQEQALKLSVGDPPMAVARSDRLALLKFIVESLEIVPEHTNNPAIPDPTDIPVEGVASKESQARRAAEIRKMRGLLKTDQPAPTDGNLD